MLRVGLTGSIAMGKSTTARMFREMGCQVFDADAAVHALYAEGGKAVPVVGALFPEAIISNAVDRTVLSSIVLNDSGKLKSLEQAVHPLVRTAQVDFITTAAQAGYRYVILDIPLLFETGQADTVDIIVVVSASPQIQRTRALERPGMTEEKFAEILRRQTPDAEKRARADFIVDTGTGMDAAFDQVRCIVDELNRRTAAGADT
jgi:dephospho-CoA kinase